MVKRIHTFWKKIFSKFGSSGYAMDGDLHNLVRAIPALKDILNKAVRIVDIHKIKTQVFSFA